MYGRGREGTGAESDNGARARCTGVRKGREGTGARERNNGARGRCTSVGKGQRAINGALRRCTGAGKGQRAITAHGDRAWVQGGQGADRNRATTVHADGARVYGRGREGTGAESDNGALRRCTGVGKGQGGNGGRER